VVCDFKFLEKNERPMTKTHQAIRTRLAELGETASVIDAILEQTDPEDIAPIDLARAMVRVHELADALADVDDELRRATGVALPVDEAPPACHVSGDLEP
jgi:hypothetical protein